MGPYSSKKRAPPLSSGRFTLRFDGLGGDLRIAEGFGTRGGWEVHFHFSDTEAPVTVLGRPVRTAVTEGVGADRKRRPGVIHRAFR